MNGRTRADRSRKGRIAIQWPDREDRPRKHLSRGDDERTGLGTASVAGSFMERQLLSRGCGAERFRPHVFGVLTGYQEPPADVQLKEGQFYNQNFPGHIIAMPPPLSDGAVTYTDGTQATVPQMAADISTFLAWAAEPNLEARKRMGVKTVLFLIVFTGLLYAVKRKIWLGVKH